MRAERRADAAREDDARASRGVQPAAAARLRAVDRDLALLLLRAAHARALGQLLPELLHLHLQLAHLGHRLVAVRAQLYRLGAVGVHQRAQRLVRVRTVGRYRREHHRQSVAAEALLKHARQLRVAVRHERALPALWRARLRGERV